MFQFYPLTVENQSHIKINSTFGGNSLVRTISSLETCIMFCRYMFCTYGPPYISDIKLDKT